MEGAGEREKKAGEKYLEACSIRGEKKRNSMTTSFTERGVKWSKDAVRTPKRVFMCISVLNGQIHFLKHFFGKFP